MKFIKLLQHARIGGVLRSPAEGVLHLEDGEADRLIENELGVDVSGNFPAKADKEVPVEHVTAEPEPVPAEIADEKHDPQSEIEPNPEPSPRRRSTKKED